MPSFRRARRTSTSNLRGQKPYEHSDGGSHPSAHPAGFHNKLLFRFVDLNPDVLNCVIVDSLGKEVYRIKTPHFVTMMLTAQVKHGLVRACIDQKNEPTTVEIHEMVEKQPVTSWLVPRWDSTARSTVYDLNIYNHPLFWARSSDNRGPKSYKLCASSQPSRVYASCWWNENESSIELEITDAAVHLDMLKPIIICIVIFFSEVVRELPERSLGLWDRGQGWGIYEE